MENLRVVLPSTLKFGDTVVLGDGTQARFITVSFYTDHATVLCDGRVFESGDIYEPPLAVVEGKAVYEGGVLYTPTGRPFRVACFDGQHLHETTVFDSPGGLAPSCLRWAEPRTIHKVWLNLYPKGGAGIHRTAESARLGRERGCIETRCIEWEDVRP